MTKYNLNNIGESVLTNNELIERAVNAAVELGITTKSRIMTSVVVGWNVYMIERDGTVIESKNIDRESSQINEYFGHIEYPTESRIQEFKQAMTIFHSVTSTECNW